MAGKNEGSFRPTFLGGDTHRKERHLGKRSFAKKAVNCRRFPPRRKKKGDVFDVGGGKGFLDGGEKEQS